MSEPAIKVENISKMYNILHKQKNKDDSLIGAFVNGVGDIFKAKEKNTHEEFWALKDINFEINAGDRVGIIGRNGAGKSTLLKILSRIVKPTSGRIEFKGTMASLLEVGTGFHGDLSGRENIYLNGSILGMSKREIDSKFDEIVAFSEVEKFLDTPVKRYSSGMYVRLAFAVAAHLETEILIVDEVLAVGDTNFQKKCLGKMNEISNKEGKTILFVSHNMAAIQNICTTCIYLKNGSLIDYGRTENIVPLYLRSSLASQEIDLMDRADRMGNGSLQFTGISLRDKAGNKITEAQCGAGLSIELHLNVPKEKPVQSVKISLGFDDEFGQRIAYFGNDITDQLFDKVEPGKHTLTINIPKLPLKQGAYTVTLFASSNGETTDWIQEASVLNVEAGDFFNTGKLPEDSQGNFFIEHSFKLI